MDADLELEDDPAEGEETPPTPETPPAQSETDKILGSFKGMAEAVQEQARVTRELLERQGQPTPQPAKTQADAEAETRRIMQQVADGVLDPEKAFSTIATVSKNITDAEIKKAQQSLQPFIDATTEDFIDRFKDRKIKDDPRFGEAVAVEFEKQIDKLGRTPVMRMDPAVRKEVLSDCWDAALGRVVSKKLKPVTTQIRGGGGGTRTVGDEGGDDNALSDRQIKALRSTFSDLDDKAFGQFVAGYNAKAKAGLLKKDPNESAWE